MNHRTNQTQTEVADKMGIAQDHVSKIEKTGNCTLTTFKKYVEACGKEMVIIPKREEM